MAHAAKIGQLTGELVKCVTARNADEPSFKQLHDQATKGLRSAGASHARTNQFDVQSKLDGLVEKFAVLNRDDLSTALQARLDALPTKSKWIPEILSLFLHLSDRPLDNTRLEHVEALASSSHEEQTTLTWNDIIAAEPLDEEDIWEDIERGYHSSGDDATVEGDSDDTTSTQATSISEDDPVALARLHLIQLDDSSLNAVREAREGIRTDSKAVSELVLIRETLSMMHGLPSSLYAEAASKVSQKPTAQLPTASSTSVKDVLVHFEETGTAINSLRRWTRIPQTKLAFIQSCQASIQQLLMTFSSRISNMEQRYLTPRNSGTVSVLQIRSEVDALAKPLLSLSKIVRSAEIQSDSPFALLDQLFNAICIAQMSGNAELYATLADIFVAGMKTYLRPVVAWIRTGFLENGDAHFFVQESHTSCSLGELWESRYAVRLLPDGSPSSPVFMRAFVDRIFAMGKSQAFMRALNETNEIDAHAHSRVAPNFNETDEIHPHGHSGATLDFNSLRIHLHTCSLQPFSEILAQALDSWISNISNDSASLLRKTLLYDQGLLQTMAGLSDVFCAKDGSLFQAFADALFWRMDSSTGKWKDRFMLTELVHTTIGNADAKSSQNLSISFDDSDHGEAAVSSMKQLESMKLETVFAWPVQNITGYRSSDAYTKAFTLLLQVYRAKYLLRGQFLTLRTFDSRTARLSTKTALALQLRQRLLTLINILHAHVTEVTHALNCSMLTRMETADGIDAMAAIYTEHIEGLENSLLLAENLKPIRSSVGSILELCERFAHVWKKLLTPELHGSAERFDSSSMNDDGNETFTEDEVPDLRSELDESLSFLKAGLRGVSRAGGNRALEMLAERLE